MDTSASKYTDSRESSGTGTSEGVMRQLALPNSDRKASAVTVHCGVFVYGIAHLVNLCRSMKARATGMKLKCDETDREKAGYLRSKNIEGYY